MKQAFKVCAEICHYRNKINEKAKTKKQTYEWTKHIVQLEKDLRQYCLFKNLNYNVVWDKFKAQATRNLINIKDYIEELEETNNKQGD